MTRRRDYRKLKLLGLGVFVTVFLFIFLAQKFGKIGDNTNATNLANFKAGYIISDFQMTDYRSMSESDIQNFLDSKNSCSNTNQSYYTQLTRSSSYHWHFENGHFICLAQERFGDRDGEIGFQYNESAAHIIWQAAQDYKINPKVLIVLLQKETGLITDPIPNDWDYRRATGYGCPDTAACSEKYYGFKNQVRNAASLFRIVMDGNSSYYPIGNNNVRYSPDPACGSSMVYIQNLATSALYRYTPYQPNAGALAAGYGAAPCGAYGNRNFYLYFEDWFGDITDDGVLGIPESSTITEGEYIIKSAIKSDMTIDVSGGNSNNGANIQIYSNNGSAAQKWRIESDDNGAYVIKNATFNKVLDVAMGSTKNGANVQTFAFNGSCAQKWRIVQNDDKTYTIYSVCSGRVLDVAGGKGDNGTNIQIFKSNGSVAQKWTLMPVRSVNDGEYTVSVASSSDKVIDIKGGASNAKNGTNIQVHKKNDTDAQVWKVIYGSDGYYTFLNPTANKVMDVLNAGTTDGVNVQLHDLNNSCAQKWQIVEDEGKYVIVSACSGLVLSANSSNIQINTNENNNNQKWEFAPIQPVLEGNYIIQSALKKEMVMDVSGGISVDGANVQLFTSNKTLAQKWQLIFLDDGTYTVKNLINGKVLDVAGAGTFDGANVNLYTSNKTCAQKWKIERNTDQTYTFYSLCSGKALDVKHASTDNGANVQLFTSNGSNAQRWELIDY